MECFSRCNRHVGCVGDENGAFHQRTPGTRILQYGKLFENIRHFVSSLAATDVNDHLSFTPFGELVLCYVLPVPNPPGMAAASFGDWEKPVDDALSRYQWCPNGRSRSRYGRGVRTGHRWTRGMSTSSRAAGGYVRQRRMILCGDPCDFSFHVRWKSMTRCSKRGVSCIVARTLPGGNYYPVFTTGVIPQTLSGSIIGTVTPG